MKKKILFVDDEELIIEGLKMMLPWNELTLSLCTPASNGVEAIEIIEKEHPDIVITDIKMPLMDGLQLAEYIHTKELSCKVIICTGYADFDYAKKAIEFQVNSFIMKPVDPTELQDAIQNVMRQLKEEQQNLQALQFYNNQTRNDQLTAYYLSEYNNSDLVPSENKFIMSVMNIVNLKNNSENIDIIQYFDELKETSPLYKNTIIFKNSFSSHQFILISEYNDSLENSYIYQTIYQLIENYSLNLYTKFNLLCLAGIGSIYANTHDSFQMYLRIKFMVENLPASTTYTIYFEHDFNQYFDCDQTDYKLINEFIMLMEFGNRKQVFSFYQNMINSWSTTSNALLCIKINIQQVLISMSNLFLKYNGSIYKLGHNNADIFSRIWKIQNITELINTSSILIESGYDYLFSLQNKKENLIPQITKYLNECYAQPLTLSSVANKFYINPSYLSRKFKLEEGANFKDYLNQIRLAKAQSLLVTTDFKIRTIAKIVGYEDEYYFSKKFMNTFGQSPRSYRRKHAKSENSIEAGQL